MNRHYCKVKSKPKEVFCSSNMAAALKQTTNLTGLAVIPNGRKKLIAVYNKILKELTKMPESAAYRRNTEELVKHRMAIAEKEESDAAIEQKISCGQIEELMVQAKNELSLARKFLVLKPWEPLATPSPPNQWKWPAN